MNRWWAAFYFRNSEKKSNSSSCSDVVIDLIVKPSHVWEAWEERDLQKFKEYLQRDWTDEETADLGDLLREIAKTPSETEKDIIKYAETLLEKNVEVDSKDSSGFGAIHIATYCANVPVLEALLEANVDPNLTNELGRTALHIASDSLECLKLLLSRSDVNINAVDKFHQIPVQQAIEMTNRQAVDLFMEKADVINWDITDNYCGTPRLQLSEKYPYSLEQILPPSPSRNNASRMIFLLHNRLQEVFCKEFGQEFQKYEEEKDKFLTLACKSNCEKAVHLLLIYGANPRYKCHDDSGPVCIAIEKGYSEILETLLCSMEFKKEIKQYTTTTALIVAAKSAHRSASHMKCLQMVLYKMMQEREWIDPNEKDSFGKTALFYAVRSGNESVVANVMRIGGRMTSQIIRCDTDESQKIPQISPNLLQRILDESLIHTPINKLPFYYCHLSKSKEIFELNYSFLKPSDIEREEKGKEENIPKTRLLLLMSRDPNLRALLTHPLLKIFIMYKWRQLRSIFLVNLVFYSILCVYITTYVLWMAVPLGTKDDSQQVSELTLRTSRIILECLLVVLTVREFLQAILSPKRYIRQFENYLEILFICFGGYITIQDCTGYFTPKAEEDLLCPSFGAATIVIAWLELLLLLGKHPYFAVQVQMFSLVFFSFLKFLYVYLIMILAFALSFFVLFNKCSGEGCDNSFSDIETTIFKTLAMVSGEFEWGNIPFSNYYYASHIIFTIFVFLVAIVLLNLLNGLAVQDVKIIHDDAVLQSSVARIKYICSLEEILRAVRKWGHWGRSIFQNYGYFPEKIVIDFDRAHRGELDCTEYGVGYSGKKKDASCYHRWTGCNLYCEIIQVAKESLKTKAELSKPAYVEYLLEESEKQTKSVDEIKKTNLENFDATSTRVEALLTAMGQCKEKSEEILEALLMAMEQSRERSKEILEALLIAMAQSGKKSQEILEAVDNPRKEKNVVGEINQTSREISEDTIRRVDAMLIQSRRRQDEATKKMLEETKNEILEAVEESRRHTQLMIEKLLEDNKKQLRTLAEGPGPSTSN